MRISADDYLALPECGPPWLEYIRGEAVEKPVGNAFHFQVVANMCAAPTTARGPLNHRFSPMALLASRRSPS